MSLTALVVILALVGGACYWLAAPTAADATPLTNQPYLLRPVDHYKLVKGGEFGAPRDGGRRRHLGIDLAVPNGTPVKAMMPGVVIGVQYETLGGWCVYVRGDHGDGSYSAHLQDRQHIFVQIGQHVNQGDVLAWSGDSGDAQAEHAYHLHEQYTPSMPANATPSTRVTWVNFIDLISEHPVDTYAPATAIPAQAPVADQAGMADINGFAVPVGQSAPDAKPAVTPPGSSIVLTDVNGYAVPMGGDGADASADVPKPKAAKPTTTTTAPTTTTVAPTTTTTVKPARTGSSQTTAPAAATPIPSQSGTTPALADVNGFAVPIGSNGGTTSATPPTLQSLPADPRQPEHPYSWVQPVDDKGWLKALQQWADHEVKNRDAAQKLVARARTVADQLNAAAKANDVDSALLAALVWKESAFQPHDTSPRGAKGLGQLMNGTATSLGVTDSYDVTQNLQGTAKHLRAVLDKYKSLDIVLAVYNAGPGNVATYGGVPPYGETKNYIVVVENQYTILVGKH